jgi:hypothetical protein
VPVSTATVETIETDLNASTHPPVRLTPDKSELVRLDSDAVSIIVGNPAHLSVLADSSKTLVLVPKAPGATYFTVLDAQGEVIMQRHAIVASPKKQYVRVRKSCAKSGDDNCQATQVFYCPDMCHEIAQNDSEAGKSDPQAMPADAAQTGSGNNNGAPPVTDN